jgi:hypothetical protein
MEDRQQLLDAVVHIFSPSKVGNFQQLRIPVFSKPATHFFGYSIGSLNGPMPRLSMYTCCANYGNLLVSDTLWSMYRNISTQPSNFGMACTPSGMHDKMIEALGCCAWGHAMGCFPFLFTDVLEVPASSSLSSHLTLVSL